MTEQQYPTREQIEEARKVAWEAHKREHRPTAVRKHSFDAGIDAVLALFPLPTPSAEPTVRVPESVVKAAAGHLDREGYHGTATLLLDTLVPEPTTPIEPPSIADMAPGTSDPFAYRRRVRHLARRHDVIETSYGTWLLDWYRPDEPYIREVDPATIRNVTPPLA